MMSNIASDFPSGDPAPKTPRRDRLRFLRPLFSILAVIYFLVDALFFSVLHPVVSWIGRLPLFPRMRRWIASLGRYPALALFLVPLIILEPVKPVGTYLIATGRFKNGVAVIVAGEILKLVVVERLFQINRDKLLSIPAFAWAYYFGMGWLNWLKELPPIPLLRSRLRQLKLAANAMFLRVRSRLTALRRL